MNNIISKQHNAYVENQSQKGDMFCLSMHKTFTDIDYMIT